VYGPFFFTETEHPPPYLLEVRDMATSFSGYYTLGLFFYEDPLKIEHLYHFCLQMPLSSELELLQRLQK
jgi:hypothetical protein